MPLNNVAFKGKGVKANHVMADTTHNTNTAHTAFIAHTVHTAQTIIVVVSRNVYS